MTLPVYVDFALREPPGAGEMLTLRGAEARHAVTVRRTRPGELLHVVNGRGLRVCIEVSEAGRDVLRGKTVSSVREPAGMPRISLVQALAKNGRDIQAVETGTEFGAHEFIPWQAARSVVQWKDAQKARKAEKKWEDTALAAAKQARRSWVPRVAEKTDSRALGDLIRSRIEAGQLVYLCHEEAKVSLVSHLGKIRETGACPSAVTFAVGPEGGITREEEEDLCAAGATAVLLGGHILRSATAGAWAIAVFSALFPPRCTDRIE